MNSFELHDALSFKIIQTGKLLLKKINADFLALNTEITFEQMGVLYFISTKGNEDVIQQDIAEMMNKNKSAILRSIDILEKKNYLTRVKQNIDRRSNVIRIAEKGNQVLQKTKELFLSLEAVISKDLTENEKKDCTVVLSKIKHKCNNNC
jgi:MarR family transcriptional repressor of mepA